MTQGKDEARPDWNLSPRETVALCGRLKASNAELLAALKALVEHGTDSPEHLRAEAAIAKAEGGES